MTRSETIVYHWRFEDGVTSPNPGLPEGQGRLDPPPRGWYCWVYPQDYHDFYEWMDQNCPTAECTNRFNSGDPMITVFIKEDREATMFQLRWV